MTIISSITAVSLTNSYTVVQSYIINIRIHVVMLLLLREADEDMYLQFLHTNSFLGLSHLGDTEESEATVQ